MDTLRAALDALPLPRPPDLIRFSEDDVRAHGNACARLPLERAIALLMSIDNHANPMTANDVADALRAQLKELDQ